MDNVNPVMSQLEDIEKALTEAVDDNYKYFLVDDDYLAEEELKPKDGKFISFYPSIKNALMGFENLNSGRELFVHVPLEGQKIKASKSKDPSAEVTGELWFKEPTKVKCIGKIRVGSELKAYEYNGGKVTSWNYSWLSSQDSNVVSDSDAQEEDKEYEERPSEKEATNESYIVNRKDIYYNKDKFDSGEINLCFITGHSGSGKSTMAHSKESDKIEVYELDDVVWNAEKFTMDNFKEYGDLIYSFFKGEGSKYYFPMNASEEEKKGKWSGTNYEKDIITDFVDYAIKYAKTHKDKKYIIEGVWLYCDDEKGKLFFEPSYFKDYAFYIKGTSALISALRAKKRDNTKLGPFIRGLKDRFLEEKNIRKFVDYFSNLEKKAVHEDAFMYEDEPLDYLTEKAITELEGAINTYDKLILFNEDAKYDPILKRYLYKQRLRNRKSVLGLYEQVKADNKFIRYTFPELARYQKRNLYLDTYFYTQLFFENNVWTLRKGMNLFFEFMTRLLKQTDLSAAGYTKNTVMIPVHQWDKNNDGTVWNYKVNLNPISVIYFFLYNGNLTSLKNVFGKRDLVFVGNEKYFKLNFSEIDVKDVKKTALKFKMFLIKICKNEEFDLEDVDTSADFHEEPEVLKAKIVDKIEDAKGVDLTPQIAAAEKKAKEEEKALKANKAAVAATVSAIKTKKEPEKPVEDDKVISKLTLNKDTKDKNETETIKQDLADRINSTADYVSDEDDLFQALDDDTIKSLIMSLKPEEDAVNMSAGRSNRISELEKKFLDSSIKGKTVKEILEDESNKKEVKTDLKVATPNDDWKEMSYINFDKNYNINKDILACFHHLEHTSHPIAVRKIEVKDNSNSEDRVELYDVQLEDYRGKQIYVKLDIPIMVDNRFLLRGNNKSIQTQFFNMPIIKTEEGVCQIISNYMKIFLRRFRTGNGRSLPRVAQFIKACRKYTGSKIKINFGDNSKICSKYQLPIDFIDLASEISKIDTAKFTILFDQDEIRKKYTIDESKGIPFGVKKGTGEIMYYNPTDMSDFITYLITQFSLADLNDFVNMIGEQSPPSTCTYSRASIMNSQIPLIVICAYHVGLRATMDRAGIKYELVKSKREIKDKYPESVGSFDFIQFEDGYVAYQVNYNSSLLMNGLKECNTQQYKLAEIDEKNTYLELLDNYGGRIKADGLDNFYDLMIDPMTKETLEFYGMPTNYIDVLIYANNLLADNKFIKHTDTSSRRIRRYQLIAVYTYKVIADAYAAYCNQLKHTSNVAQFLIKQSAVIDRFLTDSITSDDSVINALRDLETTNSITTKGPSGMNSDRAYSLDKRTYDDSMLNVVALSTGFAGNVGITRQATLNANVTPEGYVKSINGDTEKMNAANTLSATEALTPFGSTHDDPFRTAMTFVQTAKHQVRTIDSDPLLVTNGADEAMPYMSSDRFAFKAKKKGKIVELTDEYMMVEYTDKTKEYINLTRSIEKNSDGGYYVDLKLDAAEKLKVGSLVEPNQILAYDKESYSNSLGESNNLAYNIGKLAKVAILNSDEGFEDSGIISKKLANQLATRVNQKFDMILDKETLLLSLVKVGDHVEAGHPLMIWQSPFKDEDADSLVKLLSNKDEVSELGKRKLISEVTGTVTAIKIFRTVELDELSDSLKKVVSAYEKPYKAMYNKLKDNGIDTSQVPAHYVLPAVGKLKKAQDAILIEIYVEYLDSVGIGDKVVYWSANKAVEKNIFPEGEEPYTDFRPNEPLSAALSESGIMKRMVSSIMEVGSLNKLLIELDRKVKDILGIEYDDSTV